MGADVISGTAIVDKGKAFCLRTSSPAAVRDTVAVKPLEMIDNDAADASSLLTDFHDDATNSKAMDDMADDVTQDLMREHGRQKQYTPPS
jgi:hypothetical protein